MRKLERIETARLVLRKPHPVDAGWPRHRSLDETRVFLRSSDADWQRWPAGPYLIESRESGQLLGGTDLAFETSFRAATGYVLARDAWGLGYATEALGAMVALSSDVGLRRLCALCHPDHPASRRVLEKCEFTREGLLRRHSEFPNLRPGEPGDVLCYARVFE